MSSGDCQIRNIQSLYSKSFFKYLDLLLLNNIFLQIKLLNGVGILEAKRALNCEKRKNYKFEITANMCDGSKSEKYVLIFS